MTTWLYDCNQTKLLWKSLDKQGWASYWHQRILRELNLTSGESIEFAKLNAGVVQPSRTGINPYYLGIKIFEDIEERCNNPTEEMKRRGVKPNSGCEKMFEVPYFAYVLIVPTPYQRRNLKEGTSFSTEPADHATMGQPIS